jgi:cystathionine beta-lyase
MGNLDKSRKEHMTAQWNFDQIIDRADTGSMKWEPVVLNAKFGPKSQNLQPLWVADMDFYSPPCVRKAMQERLDHGIYGYTIHDSGYDRAMIDWYRRRHNWEIDPSWIMTSPGVVPAVNYMVQRFSSPGDHVLIQSPVYYPFAASITANGRRVCDNPLVCNNSRYEMDFKDLEKKTQDPRVKLAILCSPHNPVGRVWTREELRAFGDICIGNNVLVIADEIHCDLIMPGHVHTSFAGISQDFAKNSITAVAPSKTFNLAGLSQSSLIIPNPVIRRDMGIFFETLGVGAKGSGTLFGIVAAKAAWQDGEPWLEALIQYLYANFLYLKDRVESKLPGVKVFDLEGTYLPWIDLNPLGLSPENIVDVVEKKAGLALDHGNWFGTNGAGFERINIACPRPMLEKAVTALIGAFKA